VPVNAFQRLPTPVSSHPLTDVIRVALPLLMRARVTDAVLSAQLIAGGPVTSQQARAATAHPVMPHARAFTELARAITRLGPDERGRELHAVAPDRKGIARWWVREPSGPEA